MNKALAATVSISVGVTWMFFLVRYLWMMARGFGGVRRRMYELENGRRYGMFWMYATWRFALAERPRSVESQLLVRGWRGAMLLLVLQIVVSTVLTVVASQHAHP